MKIKMCSCALGGLTRPSGPIKIEKTHVVSPNMLVAKLSGAVSAEVATVKKGKKYYFVAPKALGGVREVPADSLTDCLNYTVGNLSSSISKGQKKGKRRKS